MKKVKGFTLIEIVVVIVLIGILSAVALPRFFDFTGQAVRAASEGMSGALASSVAMSHGMWLAEGKDSVIQVEGMQLLMNRAGYPIASAAIGATAPTAMDCSSLLAGLLSDSSDTASYVAHTGGAAGATMLGVTDANTCIFVHTQSANQGVPAAPVGGAQDDYYGVRYNSVSGMVSPFTIQLPLPTAPTSAPTSVPTSPPMSPTSGG